MKKLFSLLLSFSLCTCLCVPAFAADVAEENGCSYIIYVDSQEEYDRIVADINAANMRAQELWEQALIESLQSENAIYNQPLTIDNDNAARSNYTMRVVNHHEFIPYAGSCEMAFKATATLGTDSYNHTIFSSIRDITAYARDSRSSVVVDDTDSRIIDGGRTIAANYSTTIGVTTNTGQMSYFARLYYVEFYAANTSESGQVF